MLRLLLLSNSRDAEGRYLHHARAALAERLDGVRHAVFVPWAGVTVSWDDYAALAGEAFAAVGCTLDALHRLRDPVAAVRDADAIVVGGGNTFHLLARLHATGVLDAVRERARGGAPYVGWSAGAVVACPTIRTTNDMPIVEPPTLAALGLVPFQVNAHFTDVHPPGFQGETRRQRLAEFVAANPGVGVVGLPEGSMLRVDGDDVTLLGPHAAPVFGAAGVDRLVPGETARGATLAGGRPAR